MMMKISGEVKVATVLETLDPDITLEMFLNLFVKLDEEKQKVDCDHDWSLMRYSNDGNPIWVCRTCKNEIERVICKTCFSGGEDDD